MKIETESYEIQCARWPARGRHILANFDARTIVVYQAYRHSIGQFALENGRFGGDFSYRRMSWIKPNFLWMMYRSGWGTKEGQEIILGLRLRRSFFDRVLRDAVPSGFEPRLFATRQDWQDATRHSDVRLQWDPDHDPYGSKTERRAIQIGMRGTTLEAFGQRELIEVIDLTEFVVDQRRHVDQGQIDRLRTPIERIYRPGESAICDHLGLDSA